MKCVLCGNEDMFEDVSQRDAKSSQKLIVSICVQCGLIQQNPIPLTKQLRAYYAHHYRQDYKSRYTPKNKHIYRAGKIALQRLKYLKKVGIISGTLLDVGAGGGEFVYLSSKSGFQSQGIEPNIGYSEYAQHEYQAQVITGELEEVINTYDIITAFHVLEHFPAPISALKKLHSLLNKEGILFVEVPWIEANDASPSNIYFKAHIVYFSIDTLIAAASPYFDVVMVDTSSNLRIVFQAKHSPAPLSLPSASSVIKLRQRVQAKGWFEYLLKGKGYQKPISKLFNAIEEWQAHGKPPKKILDELYDAF